MGSGVLDSGTPGREHRPSVLSSGAVLSYSLYYIKAVLHKRGGDATGNSQVV